MKGWHVALALAWVGLVGAIIYFTGAVQLPTGILGGRGVGGVSIVSPRTLITTTTTSGGVSTSSTTVAGTGGVVIAPPEQCALPVGKLGPNALAMAKSHCKDSQQLSFGTGRAGFTGVEGMNRFMDFIFSTKGQAAFYNLGDAHPLVLIHVGAHLGGMIERYARLRRGVRLDDRIIMYEPNPANYERLSRRVKFDPRVSVKQAAVGKESGIRWFAFSGVPNTLGNGGKIVGDTAPANLTSVTEDGYAVQVVTLDEELEHYPYIDMIFMDPDGGEPPIFLGAKNTLKKTRMIVFGCSHRWAAYSKLTTNKRIFTTLANEGFMILYLGKERNILVNEGIGPEGAYDRLSSWGFCAAVRIDSIENAVTTNITALALLMTGVHDDTPFRGTNSTVCLRYLAGSLYETCRKQFNLGESHRKQRPLLPELEVVAEAVAAPLAVAGGDGAPGDSIGESTPALRSG